MSKDSKIAAFVPLLYLPGTGRIQLTTKALRTGRTSFSRLVVGGKSTLFKLSKRIYKSTYTLRALFVFHFPTMYSIVTCMHRVCSSYPETALLSSVISLLNILIVPVSIHCDSMYTVTDTSILTVGLYPCIVHTAVTSLLTDTLILCPNRHS